VASIKITERKFLSFDGNFTMGLWNAFSKGEACAAVCQYFETTLTENGHAKQ
jgi:hypothetical protein